MLASTSGAIDDSASDLFRKQLHPLVGRRGAKVILDLSQSNLINSRGVGELVSLVVNANTNSSRLIFAACSPFVSAVLDRSKLNTFFQIAGTVPEAIRLLSAQDRNQSP